MFYDDCSKYKGELDSLPMGRTPVNIGWIDELHGYPKGSLPAQFLERLKRFYPTNRINHVRGFHICPFCDLTPYHFPNLEVDGETIILGSAEIYIESEAKIFVAPDLLYHYIDRHCYRPPEEFVLAVMECKHRR